MQVYSVSQLNQLTRLALERQFLQVWVEGEVSNLAKPASGHWYFSLKDANAQVRCVMFRPKNRLLMFPLDNGQRVLALANASLYEGRGEFQLLVDHLERAGQGALLQAFERLKVELQQQGLFTHRRPLPRFPRRIGVMTSPTGAAVRDILQVLQRRYSLAEVYIYPVAVQGQQAVPEIVAMLGYIAAHPQCEVLIVARGGGSMEDLWAFNEAAVAAALFECPIPVVTGIGHEIDTTIADFVADHRASTPSAAAELVSPQQADWQHRLYQQQQQLQQALVRLLKDQRQQFQWLQRRLLQQHPLQHLNQQGQRLDHLQQRLFSACQRYLVQQQQQLSRWAQALHTLSPLATLNRGYAIALNAQNQVVQSTTDLVVNEVIRLRLATGQVECCVTRLLP